MEHEGRVVEDRGGDRLGDEPARRVQLDDLAAEGPHDPPADGIRAQRDRGGGRELDPQRDRAAGVQPARDERQDDDSIVFWASCKQAAMISAARGVSARVEADVAIALAAS